jgi:hypothetical protein
MHPMQMNEPHGRKVKYDDGAQMTDAHKRMRPRANLSGCPATHNSYKPYSNRRSKGDRRGKRPMEKPVTARVFGRGHGLPSKGTHSLPPPATRKPVGETPHFRGEWEEKSPRPRSWAKRARAGAQPSTRTLRTAAYRRRPGTNNWELSHKGKHRCPTQQSRVRTDGHRGKGTTAVHRTETRNRGPAVASFAKTRLRAFRRFFATQSLRPTACGKPLGIVPAARHFSVSTTSG